MDHSQVIHVFDSNSKCIRVKVGQETWRAVDQETWRTAGQETWRAAGQETWRAVGQRQFCRVTVI